MKTVKAKVWFLGDIGDASVECTRTYATNSLFDAIETIEQEILTQFGRMHPRSQLTIEISRVAA